MNKDHVNLQLKVNFYSSSNTNPTIDIGDIQ